MPFLCGLEAHSNPILSHLEFINIDFGIFSYGTADFRMFEINTGILFPAFFPVYVFYHIYVKSKLKIAIFKGR